MKRKPRPKDESIFAGGLGTYVAWVSVLLTIVTLIGYIYGYVAHEMDPLSPTLALEYRSSSQLTDLIGEDSAVTLIPTEWDALTEGERRDILISHEGDEASEEAGSGGIIGEAEQYARTISFTVLAFGQILHVFALHSGDTESFFKHWFRRNPLLLYAGIVTLILQLAVIYVPFLQHTFETAPLSAAELAITIVLAFIVFIAVEIEKGLRRAGVLKQRVT